MRLPLPIATIKGKPKLPVKKDGVVGLQEETKPASCF